jgi:hypothetical protein
MTDSETLYLVLVVLYLLEGAAWVPRGSIALCARSAEWALPRLPHRTIGNARGGAVLGFPFLSGATVFIVPQWPVSLSPRGVLFWVAESMELEERAEHPGHFFRFESIRTVSANGRSIWINDEAMGDVVSPGMAQQIVDIVQTLKKLPEKERANAIDEFLAKRFDVQATKSRLQAFYEDTANLRTASFVTWFIMLVLVPALSLRLGFERIWLLALAVIYASMWITTVLWVRLHRRYFPTERLARWGYTVMLALVPVSAMRALDLLAKRFLHDVHPAAAVAAMAPKDRAQRFLSYLLRDARFPMHPTSPADEADIRATEEFYRQAMSQHMAKMLESLGYRPDELAAIPLATGDIEGEMVCPRCHARYAAEMRACEDCGGIELRAARVGESK